MRLRKPSEKAHRKEISPDVAIVRELHVFGKAIEIGSHEKDSFQHIGLGKKLMKNAEEIAKNEFRVKRLLVISAIGSREYYQKLGYMIFGPYMAKELR